MDFDPPSADVELGDVRKVECQIRSRLSLNVNKSKDVYFPLRSDKVRNQINRNPTPVGLRFTPS